ncbi:Hypothetical predicted protein [Paramuricea clavata]|uniref:Uncharacterized protein n=1 Tax=Paramuricea clavata TaxID=317549 RepID=A0A7D9F050_PARCT|nr:Hypothetical predicted protein [Paramuricea clavata]
MTCQAPCTHSERERAIQGNLVHTELEKALEKSYHILQMHEVWHFPETSDEQFKDYVDTFLKIKQESSDYPKNCTTEEQKQQYVDEYLAVKGIHLDGENIKHNPGMCVVQTDAEFLIARLNKYGMCLEPNMKYPILDDIGQKFIDRAAELVKSGHTFVYVLDNIDWEEKAHDMRQDVQNRSVHAVATSTVFNCVSDEGLPDSGPQQDLKDCNVHQLMDINPLELDAI